MGSTAGNVMCDVSRIGRAVRMVVPLSDGWVRWAKSTLSRCTGVVAAACTQGKRTQHGKPQCVIRDDQPDAREGQAGRAGVAERLAVPLKPGNAGGGKGPQFKINAISGEGPGDWAT